MQEVPADTSNYLSENHPHGQAAGFLLTIPGGILLLVIRSCSYTQTRSFGCWFTGICCCCDCEQSAAACPGSAQVDPGADDHPQPPLLRPELSEGSFSDPFRRPSLVCRQRACLERGGRSRPHPILTCS